MMARLDMRSALSPRGETTQFAKAEMQTTAQKVALREDRMPF